ncbi:MAG: hypothetical protein JWM74_6167, partial [Myxococcaceae bacterium]|nr:hypothetical protein [Myxococcaceae bacterium]
KLAQRRDAPLPRGLVGVCAVAASIATYGFNSFWDLAQCENVCTVLAFASLVSACRIRRAAVAEIVSGLFGGAAVVVKPPVVWFVIAAAIAVAYRALDESMPEATPRQRATRVGIAWARFGVATFSLPLLMVGYFALHGAAGELRFWLVDVNKYYLANERGVSTFAELVVRSRNMFSYFDPYASIALALVAIGVLSAALRSDRPTLRRYLAVVGLFFAAYASVAMQLKFFIYHFLMLVGPATLLAGVVFLDLEAWLARARSEPPPDVAPGKRALALAGALFLLFPLARTSNELWWPEVRETWRWVGGTTSREEFTRLFTVPVLSFSFHDCELTGLWLREHSNPEDSVAVRGFEPQIYAVARRRYHHRFFWTNFITDARRSLRHAEWLREEEIATREDPPRFAVTIMDSAEVVGTDWYAPLGYVERARFGDFRVLEHVPSAAK